MPVTIRPVNSDDCEDVVNLAAELGYDIGPIQGEDRLSGVIADPSHLFLVAEFEDGRIAGWAHAALPTKFLSGRHVELYGLIVGKQYRGRGTGDVLLANVENWARKQGCEQVMVRSNVIRDRAHEFYKSRGYSEKKRQVFLVKTLDSTCR